VESFEAAFRLERCASRAAKLFRRLFEIVRSMIAPQLMHFQA
jgi:DNA repair protein RadC